MRKIPHELILFFNANFKPKEIIAKGYPESTVYKYKQYYEEALIKFREKAGVVA